MRATSCDESKPVMRYDRIIYNGVVVTVNPRFDVIADGLVCITDGIIRQVQQRRWPILDYPAEEYVDASGGLILPGLVNAHTHLPMSLFRGLADDLPQWEWLNNHIFPAEKKYINLETVRIGTLLSCAEMIMSGATTCCDGYFFEDSVAQAFMETGLRGVLAQGVIDFPAPGVPDPTKNIEVAADFVSNWKTMSPLIVPSIFCHSPYTCCAETLIKAKQVAEDQDVLFQIHVSETKAEVDQMRAEKGVSPIKYLDSLGVLDRRTLIHHAVWIDDHDMDILSKRNVSVIHCPESNMKLASGVSPVPQMIKRGICVGLGTDGCASNNNLDMFDEMDSAAKLHKAYTKDPTVMDAKTVLKMATIEGAKAIGLDDQIGTIEPGKQADIIIIDTHKPHLTPMYHPESHLVYAAQGSDVRDVFVSGEPLLQNYHFVRLNVRDILKQASLIASAVGSSN
jgi:5-methylthioadenosine/S-adenosylhomocysteine deaminase